MIEAPFTSDYEAEIYEDTSVEIKSSQLLSGFSDADGDILTISSIKVSHGDLSYDPNSEFHVYSPDQDFNGNVTVDITVADIKGQ